MKLYTSDTSPYGRLARIVRAEKALEDRVELVFMKTRIANDPLYDRHPSGRVPCLELEDGRFLEDSVLVCTYLDELDGSPRFGRPEGEARWDVWRREAVARSLLDGLSVWVRELRRAEGEYAPGVIELERNRARRMADALERDIGDPAWQGPFNMAQILLITTLQMERRIADFDWREGHPGLVAWEAAVGQRPSVAATVPPT